MIKFFVAVVCVLLPSSLTRVLFRLCGYRIGRNVRIPALSFVYAREMTLGNDVDIRRFCFIHLRRLALGANTIVSYGCQIKGEAGFTCGDFCFLGVQCIIHCVEDVTFGNYSGLGPRCTVYTHGSFLPVTEGYPSRFAPVVFEDRVWVAMEVSVMPGAHVERNCVINPHVVVQGRIKADSILQLDPKAFARHDLRRLQLIARKDAVHWHHQIISGFLTSRSLKYLYDEGASSYTVPGKLIFLSKPEENSIELRTGRSHIVYDLEHFQAGECHKPIHKAFLGYIRLHFGLVLKTRYR